MALTTQERNTIELAMLRCRAITDVKNEGCGIEAEHKGAVKCYLRTWVIPQLENLLLAPKSRVISHFWNPI